MIQGTNPIHCTEDKAYYETLRKLFRSRMRKHYGIVLQQIKTILNYWPVYLYAVIGLAVGIVFLLTVIEHKYNTILSEAHNIYLSFVYFLIATQFSIKYFFQAADLIHFRHNEKLMLLIRKYAIYHSLFYHLSNWLFIFMLLSPIYFHIFNHSIVHYSTVYFFVVSFSLTTSLIRKESKFNLRDINRTLYYIINVILTIVLQMWFIMIFCFADIIHILLGISINLLIFMYTYKWGSRLVIPTLAYLVQHDNRPNILSSTIVGNLTGQAFNLRPYRRKPIFLCRFSKLGRKLVSNYILGKVIFINVMRSSSYFVMMIYLFAVTGIALFTIEYLYQFFLLALITLYISFLIHRQHVEYFYTHTLIKLYLKQRLKKQYYDIKMTILVTVPIILIMYITFLILNN